MQIIFWFICFDQNCNIANKLSRNVASGDIKTEDAEDQSLGLGLIFMRLTSSLSSSDHIFSSQGGHSARDWLHGWQLEFQAWAGCPHAGFLCGGEHLLPQVRCLSEVEGGCGISHEINDLLFVFLVKEATWRQLIISQTSVSKPMLPSPSVTSESSSGYGRMTIWWEI